MEKFAEGISHLEAAASPEKRFHIMSPGKRAGDYHVAPGRRRQKIERDCGQRVRYSSRFLVRFFTGVSGGSKRS
jgi:hypothetical protein